MNQRILLVDDHEIFLQGLFGLLAAQPGIEVVGEAHDGREAIEAAHELQPHQVVTDLEMSGMNGIEATRRLTSEVPQVKVICLSMHSESHFVESAMDAGASGYVLKDYAFEELVRAIGAVAAGELYVCPAATRHLVEIVRSRPANRDSVFRVLTNREREVLQLLAEGLPSKQIASRLGIAVKTVGAHRERIVEKTGVRSIAGLTKYAVSEGLTDLATGR